MSRTVHYLCPNCNGPILHEIPDNGRETDHEVCGMCGTKSYIKDLESKPAYNKGGESEATYAGASASESIVSYIDEAESALAYLENYFDNYDWDDFAETSALSIPVVDKIVDKILIKSASNPATWELQFMAVTTPLLKKLGGLKKLETKFCDEYVKNDDFAESFVYFDTYRRLVNKLATGRHDILKKLNNAIKYYKKYNGSEEVLQSMTAQFASLETSLNAVKRIEDYKELPGYSAAKSAKQQKVIDKLAANNINAEEVYNDAVAAYNGGGDMRPALEKFNSIIGYKDANEYAEKIDAWLKFAIPDGIFIRLGRKYYRIKRAVAQSLPMNNLNNAAQNQAQQPAQENGRQLYNMYEIVNKQQVSEPCVTGITNLLCCYGGVLFYVKNGNSICSFNSETSVMEKTEGEQAQQPSAETVIMSYRPQDICFDIISKSCDPKSNLYLTDNKLFILRKLNAIAKEEKKGCLGGLFGKKEPEVKVVTKNNFSLVALNLVNSTLEAVIPELVDIHCIYGDEIFYESITTTEGRDSNRFYAYNRETGENRTVLNAETEIVDVVDGKAVYFLQSPNDYNKDLYVYDFKSGASRLIETNVFEYFRHVDGMFYYFVGNEDVKTLYRVNADGTGKIEIKNNRSYFEDALAVRNGWLYFLTGKGINQALVKMSTDGSKYIPLCRQFKKLVIIKDGYIYYVDYFNTLCMVREDGSEQREIIDHVENFIEVTDSAIYLLRSEKVDETATTYVWSNSLYSVNFDGEWLKKVAFNVASAVMSPGNQDEIYLYKTKRVTYKVEVPVDKERYNTEYKTVDLKLILLYNVCSETFKEVAVLDTPDTGSYTFKSGCFKKPVTKEVIITEIPNRRTFKRGGLMQAGATANEQLRREQAQNVAGSSSTYRASGNSQAVANNTKAVRNSIATVAITFFFMISFVLPFALGALNYPSALRTVKIVFGVVLLIANIAQAAIYVLQAIKTKKSIGKLDMQYLIASIVTLVGTVLSIVIICA